MFLQQPFSYCPLRDVATNRRGYRRGTCLVIDVVKLVGPLVSIHEVLAYLWHSDSVLDPRCCLVLS